jgi:hypothetical protein
MASRANALLIRIRTSAFGLRSLHHPHIAPSRAPILLHRLLGVHRRHILRVALRLMSPYAREMPWRLGLYCPQAPGNHATMPMIRRKKIWCARIDRNCVGSDGSVSCSLIILFSWVSRVYSTSWFRLACCINILPAVFVHVHITSRLAVSVFLER